jgi:hypothetical protein
MISNPLTRRFIRTIEMNLLAQSIDCIPMLLAYHFDETQSLRSIATFEAWVALAVRRRRKKSDHYS